MGLVVASVLADELLGVITKVDADAKKITVIEKDTDKEIELKITDDTEYVTKKGTVKVDFEKLEKGIEKAKEKGEKGITAKITHEKKVASKIEISGEEEEESGVKPRAVVHSAGRDARQSSASHAWFADHDRMSCHDVAMHVGEAIIAAGMAVCEAGVVEPHQVQDGGVEIMNVHRVLHRADAVLVGRPVHAPAPHAGPGQPGAEGPAMMLAALVIGCVVERRPAELRRPDDEYFDRAARAASGP